MTAVDTNVLVRLLTGDDAKQTAAARSLFVAGPIWIAKTVLLETSWVLRSLYGLEESAIRNAFNKLLGLQNVHVEDRASMAAALRLTVNGIQLADAMHLSADRWVLCLFRSTGPSFAALSAPAQPKFLKCAGKVDSRRVSWVPEIPCLTICPVSEENSSAGARQERVGSVAYGGETQRRSGS